MTEHLVTIFVALAASSGFWALVSKIYDKKSDGRERKEEDSKVIKAALLALLHDALYDKCTTILEVGAISPEDFENIDTMIKPYEALGGNGTIHKLWAEIKDLPTYKEEKLK